MRCLRFLPLILVGCYAPAIPNGKQECGPKGECADGYFCAADHRCYKMGSGPTADMSVPHDMAVACTDDTCKNGPKPVCDPETHGCVECLQDADCPLGKVCKDKACVAGCTDQHGCPSGMCVNGMCSVCKGDGDCAPPTAKCDVGSGKCVGCLTTADCKPGEFCDPDDHACHQGCDSDNQCAPTADGGNQMMKCCNHVCYDVNKSDSHCGDCGTDCQGMTCCAGFCSDPNMDIANCGGCGRACSGGRAMWLCVNANCTVNGCNPGFDNCNKIDADGCEANLNTDVANCKTCGNVCVAPNATPLCSNGACGVGPCNGGFADCNMKSMDGCEVSTASDPMNCGGCGNVCALAHATAACIGGKCAISQCDPGFANCDGNDMNGCEKSTDTDVANCGGCNAPCMNVPNANIGCVAGKCVITACTAANFKDCDGLYANGCERNINTDVAHCGGCGRACLNTNVAALACAGGLCTSTCVAGFGNCSRPPAPNPDNGCETNLTNDKNNCGSCGNVCPINTSCANSMCGGIQMPCSQVATAACLARGWVIPASALAPGRLYCVANNNITTGFDCNGCVDYNMYVWTAGAKPAFCQQFNYSTVAGQIYAGHNPCQCGDNLIPCGGWNMQNCIPD